MKKRVKMVDVARVANVSRTTVSLILNQVPGVRIAEATRQRVLQTARDLGYSPGPLLEEIDSERKRVFGVLINEISAAYPIDLLYGLQSWADAQGYQIVIQVTDGSTDHETAALDIFSRLAVQGVVYATTFTSIIAPHPALDKFRHVLLNCRRKARRGFSVLPAERHGGALAAEHLIALGRRRIATITGDPWQFASIERLAGYHRALNAAGMKIGPEIERSSDWSHAKGYAAALDLLSGSNSPDAFFCHNDLIARGAMAAARDRGLKVPEDIAVIGYDDREFARDLGISTITLPLFEMAERAMAELASSTPLPDKTITIPGQLIGRASTLGDAPMRSRRQPETPLPTSVQGK